MVLLPLLHARESVWLRVIRNETRNEIIPIGQPAQFFGFVSIRHKSGHAANRGDITRSFQEILNPAQRAIIDDAVERQIPVVREFLEERHQFLNELHALRSDPSSYVSVRAEALAREMGRLEMAIAKLEAETYRDVRDEMSDEQLRLAMNLRGNYIIDESQIVSLSMADRGATLSVLCSGCHGDPGAWRDGMPGPNLDRFWDRPIASERAFEFSDALQSVALERGPDWTPELLDEYLASPDSFAPGTKMEFQGFLSADDRRAIVEHLQKVR